MSGLDLCGWPRSCIQLRCPGMTGERHQVLHFIAAGDETQWFTPATQAPVK